MSEEEINVHHKMDHENSESYSEAISEEVNVVQEQLHLKKNEPNSSSIFS